jgi:spore coat polysaccharide biosynthesis protein SpsF
MKIGAIIQARYDSTRLPGKVLMNLPFGEKNTVLDQIINRLKKVNLINEIIIATSEEDNDNIIKDFTKDKGIVCVRGHKNNVLARFVKAIDERNLDIVIRVTGDNPIVLIDILETAIKKHLENKADYTRNLNLPYGTSFEIINAVSLKRVYRENNLTTADKEHVTIYIKNNRENFNILELEHKVDYTSFRFTIDYPTDYAAINLLFQYLSDIKYEYNLKSLLDFISENEWIQNINKSNHQKREYKDFNDELSEGIKILNNLELKRVVSFLIEKTK